jgi:hypothetical protein
VDDKGKMVLPALLAPPGRPMTKTEESLRGHTDALKLPGLSTVMSALAFTDDVDEHGTGELLEALDSMMFVADDDADAIMPVRLFDEMLDEESGSDDDGHAASSGGGKADGARAAELLAPKIYGRAQNRSMRLILKATAAEEMEEQRAAAVAAADASAAATAAKVAAAAAAVSAVAPAAAAPKKRKRATSTTSARPAAAAAAAAAVTVDDDEDEEGGDDDGGDD